MKCLQNFTELQKRDLYKWRSTSLLDEKTQNCTDVKVTCNLKETESNAEGHLWENSKSNFGLEK